MMTGMLLQIGPPNKTGTSHMTPHSHGWSRDEDTPARIPFKRVLLR
jgi:hypothetical protein